MKNVTETPHQRAVTTAVAVYSSHCLLAGGGESSRMYVGIV